MESIYDEILPSSTVITNNTANIYYIDLDSKTTTLADHISAIKNLSDFTNTTVPIYFYFIGYNVRDFKDFGISYLCNYIKQLSTNNVFEACNVVIRGILMSDILKMILDTNIPVTIYSDAKISTLEYDGGITSSRIDTNINYLSVNEYKKLHNLEFTVVD